MTDGVPKYAYSDLLAKITNKLVELGFSHERAKIEAEIMIEADILEVPSHGIKMLSELVSAVESGLLKPDAKVEEVTNFAAICVKNYGNGPGRTSALDAMMTAVNKAKKYGIGLCVAQNTTHWGRAHAYVSRAASAGCFAFCATNAIPSMTFGQARSAVLGNNPLGMAAPTSCQERPVVLDMAMSQVAVGKIATLLRENSPVPDGVGIDAEGKATNSAREILDGAVTPMAGYKGEGLAVMLEFMTAVLAGGKIGADLAGAGQNAVDASASKIFIAIDVAIVNPLDEFTAAGEYFCNYLKSVSPSTCLPGERGWDAAARNAREVPVHVDIVRQLRALAINI